MMSHQIDIRVFNSLEDVCCSAVDMFYDLVEMDVDNTFIVPGGKTPILFYQYLSQRLYDWTNINLLVSDERIIAENHPESNTGMIKRNLLDRINKRGQSLPYYVPILNGFLTTQTKEILSSLKGLFKLLVPPKAAFLGIGADGHTASLFKCKSEEFFNGEPFVLVKRLGDSYHRISISSNILCQIPLIVFLVSGRKKKGIIDKIINNPNDNFNSPIHQIISNAKGKVVMLCDHQALPTKIFK